MKTNRIAIKLISPDDLEMRDRFYNCARRLKRTLEREMKVVSTVGEEAPRRVGLVASLTEIDDVIWIRAVSNDDVIPCKSLIRVAAEQAKISRQILVSVNPSPMVML